MIIGLLTVRIHIPMSDSLKSKRMVIRSLKDRLRNRFNVSVAEVAEQDKWQLAELGISCVSTDKASADSMLSKAADLIYDFDGAEIIDHRIELF